MKLNLPESAIVRGELVPPSNLRRLTQDMLEVELRTGVFVDAGWYPEHDPQGEYVIIAFQDDPDEPLQPPLITRNFFEAVSFVERLAHRYSQATLNMSGASSVLPCHVENPIYA